METREHSTEYLGEPEAPQAQPRGGPQRSRKGHGDEDPGCRAAKEMDRMEKPAAHALVHGTLRNTAASFPTRGASARNLDRTLKVHWSGLSFVFRIPILRSNVAHCSRHTTAVSHAFVFTLVCTDAGFCERVVRCRCLKASFAFAAVVPAPALFILFSFLFFAFFFEDG